MKPRLICSLIVATLAAIGAPAFASMKAVVNVEESFSVTSLAVTPDGSTIVASLSDGSIRQFNASSGKQISQSTLMPKAVAGIAVTGNGKKLFIASDKLYLMDLHTGALEPVNTPFAGAARAVAADTSGQFGAAASGSNLDYYNLTAKRHITGVRTTSEIYAVVVDTLTQTVYTGSKDGFIRAYSMAGATLKSETAAHIGRITSIVLCGNMVLAGGDKGAVLLPKDFTEKSIPHFLPRHADTVRAVAATADGRFAVTGGDDAVAVVWDLVANRTESMYMESKLPVIALAVDPYFRYVAVATARDGDMGGVLTIRYTADKRQERNIYAFRDGTLTLDAVGYADGTGLFGKYLQYQTNSGAVPFSEVSNIVHKPGKLAYNMPRPRVAAVDPSAVSAAEVSAFTDTKPPVISVNERGFAPVKKDEIRVIEGQITDESKISWAKVGANPLVLNDKGEFRIEVAVPESGKTIILSAADIYGNSAEKVVTLASQAVQYSPASVKERKLALLIGINEYKYLPTLRTPEFDVHTLGEILRSKYGYEIIKVLGASATRDGVLSEINRLRKQLGKDDSLVVYYAGHGYLDTASGNAYWQLYDGAVSDDTRWLLTSQVTSNLAAYDTEQILVISDSCFSGAVANISVNPTGALKAVISSGGNEPVGDIGSGGHSVFTSVLISALKTPSAAPFTGSLLYKEIINNISLSAKQAPQFKKFTDDEFIIK